MGSRTARLGSLPSLLATCLLLSVPSAVFAQSAKWEFREAVFETCAVDSPPSCQSGGQATGYVVLNASSQPVDWAIYVSGSVEGGFTPFIYDPTTSTARFAQGGDIRPQLRIAAPDEGAPVRMLTLSVTRVPNDGDTIFLGLDAALNSTETSDGLMRTLSAASKLQTDFAPVILLKINQQHPGTRVVSTPGPVRLSLDVLPSARTGPFQWYWAIIVDGRAYWISSSGLSVTPKSFATQMPPAITDLGLLDAVFSPGVHTHVMYLMEGSTLVTADWITAQVGG